MPASNIILGANYLHFITFNVYRRRRLLDLDQPKRILLGVLGTLRHELHLKCLGFVIMPNHVHALIWLPPEQTLRYFMHEWKRRSSLQIRAWYAAKAANYFQEFGFGKRFWQPRYHSFEIDNAPQGGRKTRLHAFESNPSALGYPARGLEVEFGPVVS